MTKLGVYINNELASEYDKETEIDEQKQEFLDKMDADMDKGIRIRGELIGSPDTGQKATFVAMNMIRALQQDNHGILNVSCAWLVNRNPRLEEVRISDSDDGIAIDFVEEQLN